MVEDVIEGSGRFLLSILRGVWWFIAEIICDWFLGAIGWACGRLFSLGRWPACGVGEIDQLPWAEHVAVVLLGAFSVAALGLMLFKYVF